MTVETHLDSLVTKRAQIKQSILEEKQRPCPDSLELSSLKRQNLRLKEEIARLSSPGTAKTA